MGNSPKSYQGFWGIRSGTALEELADFLSWKKQDWVIFEQWMDELEKKPRTKKQPKASRKKWESTVNSLKRREAIIIQKLGDRIVVRLSEKGWRAVRLKRLRAITRQHSSGWCLVVFDFPESEHHARDMFRALLKSARFGQFQRSVWISPRDVGGELVAIIKELGIWRWVAVFDAKLRYGKIEFLEKR